MPFSREASAAVEVPSAGSRPPRAPSPDDGSAGSVVIFLKYAPFRKSLLGAGERRSWATPGLEVGW
jgi:hypothetical protein